MIMQCTNAKDKIKEAKHFLDILTSDEVYKDDDLYSYNVTAFLSSTRSVIDYIVSDFLDYVKPKISLNEWKKTKGSKKRQKKIIEKHPQKEKILAFFKFYEDVQKILRSDPLVYYFLEIRNEVIHYRKISAKGMTVTSTNHITKEFSKMRTLEIPFNAEGLEKYPQYKIDYDNKLSKEQIFLLEQDIRHTDAKIHLRKFLHKIIEFENKFEMLNI